MSTLSVAEVRAAIAGGATPEFLLFWGHRPRPDGSVGPGCLSQWWPAGLEVDGQRFASASPVDRIWGIGLPPTTRTQLTRPVGWG